MKKVFLLFYTLLIIFAFSLNSSVFSNSLNKQNNNSKNSTLAVSNNSSTLASSEETNEIKIIGNPEISDTTAEVHYSIENSTSKITFLYWSFPNETEFSKEKIITGTGDETYYSGEEPCYGYNGFIRVTNLQPSSSYNNTYLKAQNEDGVLYKSEEINFVTLEEGLSNGNVEQHDLIEETTSATTSYTISPSENTTPQKISWKDSEGNELAESKNINSENEGEIETTTELEPGITYKGTYLVVEAQNNDSEIFHYSSDPFDVLAKNESDTTQIWNNGDVVTKENTATVNYEIKVGPGNATIETISWLDKNDALFGNATINDSSNTGTLTATCLTTNETYSGTYLEVKMSDGNRYVSKPNPINSFTIYPQEVIENLKTQMIIYGSTILIILFLFIIISFVIVKFRKQKSVKG